LSKSQQTNFYYFAVKANQGCSYNSDIDNILSSSKMNEVCMAFMIGQNPDIIRNRERD